MNGFCAAAQPGQGNQPQMGALPAAADLPGCEGDERGSSGKPTFQESSSFSLLRLVVRMSQTRWAAIEQPALKHTLLILPVTFRHPLPKSVRTARTSIATCSSASKRLFACLPVMPMMRTVARVQRSAARMVVNTEGLCKPAGLHAGRHKSLRQDARLIIFAFAPNARPILLCS